jgi:hypothetical protein
MDLVIVRGGHVLNVKFSPGETRVPSVSALNH